MKRGIAKPTVASNGGGMGAHRAPPSESTLLSSALFDGRTEMNTQVQTADPIARIAAFAAEVGGMIGQRVVVLIDPDRGFAELAAGDGGSRYRTSFCELDHAAAVKAARKLTACYEAATECMRVDALVAQARAARRKSALPAAPVPAAVHSDSPYYPAGRRGE